MRNPQANGTLRTALTLYLSDGLAVHAGAQSSGRGRRASRRAASRATALPRPKARPAPQDT